MSQLTKNQKQTFAKQFTDVDGLDYKIVAELRHDDSCGNGHNTFAITGTIYRITKNGRLIDERGGCIHDEIARHFPELAPFIKWHLCSTDGPLHYVANTVYHAGNKDHNGLLKGEKRQIKNGKTGLPCWELVAVVDGDEVPIYKLPKYADSETAPVAPATLEYRPWCRIGEGKERDLNAARESAIWPEATDEELTAPDLKERLLARLPGLLAEFRAAVESLGFTY